MHNLKWSCRMGTLFWPVYDVDAGQSVEDVYKQIDVILTKIMEEKSN